MKKWMMMTALMLPMAAGAAQVGEYISGGIGSEERSMFEQRKSEFNLEVKTALTSGHYLGNVEVSFIQGDRVVLQGVTDGPFFFAKLAPGKYTVHARYNDQELIQTVSAPESGMHEVMFRFKGDEPVVEGSADTADGPLMPEDANAPLPWNGPRQVKDPNKGDGVYFRGYDR
jgi:hypothetical protein